MILLCMEFLTFCNFDKNHNVGLTLKDNYYNIEFIEKSTATNLIDIDIIGVTRHSEYISQISNWGYYDGVVKFIYSWNKKNHLFDGDDLEIIFTRERVGKRSLMRPENYIISVKKVKDKLKAILIIWQNGGELPKKDTNKLYLGDREYDLSAEDNNPGKYFSNNMKFEWEIGATTDTLWTNLSKEILQKLYPKFSGKYHEIKVDSIFVNYDYPTETYDFYNNIYFNNFKLGFTRDYCKIIDFIKKMH